MLFKEKKRLVTIAISILLVQLFFYSKAHAQCSQNNFAVTELYFLDVNGKPIDPSLHTIGSKVTGRIYARFSGSANNSFFPLHFANREEVAGILASSTSSSCVQNTTGLSSNQIPKNELVYLFNYEITWGSETFFREIYMTWRTNEGQSTCRTNEASGQCFASPEGLRVSVEFSQLPVIWQDFSVNRDNKKQNIILKWSTVKEWESSHFEIERSIAGVESFEVIGHVKSLGYSDKPTTYHFTDHQIPFGSQRLYYRIKQVDLDGTVDYSKTILAENKTESTTSNNWQVFPNPMQDASLRINYLGANLPEKVEVRIYALGHSKKLTLQTVEKNMEIGHILQEFPKGVLIMEIIEAESVENIRIIKR
ncbi:T9SS type A sorting domain-containing protein [Cecembia calidifontis]|uniref:Secreted protein (Por secretion system target) n=1 Tax=Cecembia calidifontis TaxID=1187080 RepID=A0A4Q7P8H3_9BACT|nr:T9SS type A sorting domain-containing protein [Cecembia calidifontis]RZS95770.1 hypothetical protein BC751_1311 [Cecembia calidifontis]